MFGLGLLVAFTLLVSYVAWRASSAAWIAARTTRRHWLVGSAALWLLFAAGRLAPRDGLGSVGPWIELVALDLLVALFLTATSLVAVELVTAGGFLLRAQAPKLRLGALFVGATLTAAAVVQGTRAPSVREHSVPLPGLPPERDGTVIVALSDLHVGRQLDAQWLAARVAEANALEPDLIVLLGDIVEGRSARSAQAVAPLEALEAPLGVWAVLGNHERSRARTPRAPGAPGETRPSPSPDEASSSADGWHDALFARLGIGVLRDEAVAVAPGLVLAGVDDLTARRRSGTADGAVERTLATRPAGATVLLSHTPWQVEQAASAGAGLMLSGHTHGGQIWPFGAIASLAYPYLAGRFAVGDMTLLVSRGTGSWGPRMRLWHRGEILRVTLRAGGPPGSPTRRALDAVTERP